MNTGYPLGGFYFQLSFSGVKGAIETSFKEVSGISMEMAVEEISEGGENRFKHRVPNGNKFQNLVLKRGLVSADSELSDWCTSTISGGLNEGIKTKTIVVKLLNDQGQPIKSWSFADAWPIKWDVSPFNSMNSELVIENLEFVFSSFNQVKGK
ncbi:MAG: phage tail protein [Bacteroidetes bacterium]|nr:MAG: phage tail protein [Bacteroidota bacterium]